MTDKEIMQAVEMRMEIPPRTWDEIGEKLGYHHSTVCMSVRRRIFSDHPGSKVKSTHPHVLRWMLMEGITVSLLAIESGLARETVSIHLNKPIMRKNLAETICKMSGLTMEQVQESEDCEDED